MIIEIPPRFSEAPHLRSSIPHPKTDFSKNQIASRRILPWAESTNVFFEIKIGIPTISGQGTPSFRNKIAEMCYLYRRTGLLLLLFLPLLLRVLLLLPLLLRVLLLLLLLRVLLFLLDLFLLVCTVFTLNLPFYPTSSVHPVSVLVSYYLLSYGRDLLIMWSQTVRQRKTKTSNNRKFMSKTSEMAASVPGTKTQQHKQDRRTRIKIR